MTRWKKYWLDKILNSGCRLDFFITKDREAFIYPTQFGVFLMHGADLETLYYATGHCNAPLTGKKSYKNRADHKRQSKTNARECLIKNYNNNFNAYCDNLKKTDVLGTNPDIIVSNDFTLEGGKGQKESSKLRKKSKHVQPIPAVRFDYYEVAKFILTLKNHKCTYKDVQMGNFVTCAFDESFLCNNFNIDAIHVDDLEENADFGFIKFLTKHLVGMLGKQKNDKIYSHLCIKYKNKGRGRKHTALFKKYFSKASAMKQR